MRVGKMGLYVLFVIGAIVASHAQAQLNIETFETANGWTSAGDGVFAHEGTGGNPGGYLSLSFSTGVPPLPVTGVIVADANASDGAFAGDIAALVGGDGLSVSFSLRTTLTPTAMTFSFTGAINSWNYTILDTLSLSTWQNISIPLDDITLANWSSPDGNLGYNAFEIDLENVSEMRLSILMPTTGASELGIDNFQIIPEPSTLMLVLAGLGLLRLSRRRA
jgi:hypothetical protein